jgi:hypothetical protein
MIHYTGWYFCTKNNWDGNTFDARNLVSIDKENAKNLIIKCSLVPNIDNRFSHYFKKLKPEVYDWLINNVTDEKLGVKGWCCGDDNYNCGYEDFSLFFYRRKDALNFIKTWSIYKRPTETWNQNSRIRKILDLKTNTLKPYKK